MKKRARGDFQYASKEQLRAWLRTTPEERMRFIEESKDLLRKAWDSRTIELVEKLRKRGL